MSVKLFGVYVQVFNIGKPWPVTTRRNTGPYGEYRKGRIFAVWFGDVIRIGR